jgi:hypothetical protein
METYKKLLRLLYDLFAEAYKIDTWQGGRVYLPTHISSDFPFIKKQWKI